LVVLIKLINEKSAFVENYICKHIILSGLRYNCLWEKTRNW